MSETTFTDETVDRIRNIHHGNFLDYLSSAYEVLRKIFSYLSIEDLENVSKAFERWRGIVETTKRERTIIESFVLSSKCQTCEIWSEASFCVTFCLEENKELVQKLKKYLKKDAQFIVMESRAGLIGTASDLSRIVQQKTPVGGSALATHLRIPSLPDVGIKTFVWKRNISFKDFRDSFRLPNNQIVKCLLILIAIQDNNRKPCEQKDDFVLYLQSTQSEGFAVGGCLIDSFLDENEDDSDDVITKYIVFYGDKVEAASTALKQDVKTRDSIDSKVEELKMMCPKTDRGVVFVFRCCSRDKIFTQHKARKGVITKWEGASLMKHFPSTPIIGCLGYGEFGRTFPDKEPLIPSIKRSRQCDIWEYSFSTTIVYVGFKN